VELLSELLTKGGLVALNACDIDSDAGKHQLTAVPNFTLHSPDQLLYSNIKVPRFVEQKQKFLLKKGVSSARNEISNLSIEAPLYNYFISHFNYFC
jgi:hypothetical protein